MTVVEERVGALAAEFTGTLLRPGDAGYDEARRIHNGLIDKRPAVIARCRERSRRRTRDRFRPRGRARDLDPRRRATTSPAVPCTEGGLMIDLAEMRAVEVDPERRTARAEGGANWNELNSATGEHGLAVTGGAISTTGIAGLTLGGGLGWLMGHPWPRSRQPPLGRARHGRRRGARTSPPSPIPTSSGLSAAAAGTSGSPRRFEYRLHPVGDGDRRPDRPPVLRQRGEMLRFYRRLHTLRARTS